MELEIISVKSTTTDDTENRITNLEYTLGSDTCAVRQLYVKET